MGAHGNVKNADENIQNVVNSVRASVESQVGNVGDYVAVCYTSQVVAGINYKIKVRLNGDNHAHLAVYVPLPHTQQPPVLNSCEAGKTLADPLA